MTSASHYVPNLRDIEFNLFEFLDIGNSSLGRAPFGDLDETAARQMLQTFAQLCTGELAASFDESEHNPPKLEGGKVTLPPGLKNAMGAFYEAGMHLLEQPPHLGGL